MKAAARTSKQERTLVLCTLYGGNDGLNTVIPYESSAYRSLRGGVAIGEDQAQPIGAVDNLKLGLHPALVGMKSLWDAGQVAIIFGVGYPNPNYSHFQSMEIMMSADPTGDSPSGWIGRWLDVSGTNPVRALSVGSQLPQVFTGDKPTRLHHRRLDQPRATSSPTGTPISSRPTPSASTPITARSTCRPPSPRPARTCSSSERRRLRLSPHSSPPSRSARTTPATSAINSTSWRNSSRRAFPQRPTA